MKKIWPEKMLVEACPILEEGLGEPEYICLDLISVNKDSAIYEKSWDFTAPHDCTYLGIELFFGGNSDPMQVKDGGIVNLSYRDTVQQNLTLNCPHNEYARYVQLCYSS